MNSTIPWIEKYRPTNLSQVISHEKIIGILHKYIGKQCLPNIIMYGPPGIGKTTMIRACANELFGSEMTMRTLEINASEERGIAIVRTCIAKFAKSYSIQMGGIKSKLKMIILDEVDSMTYDAQNELKNIIDTFSNSTRFCLICNYIKKIQPSLISRCLKIRLHPLSNNDINKYISYICENEKIDITEKAKSEIILHSHYDMRRMINLLQSIHTAYEKIDVVCVNNYINNITQKTMHDILTLMINTSILDNHKNIFMLIKNECISLLELVNYLNTIITNHICGNEYCELFEKFTVEQLCNIVCKLGKIEYQIFSNVNANVIISTICCIFKV